MPPDNLASSGSGESSPEPSSRGQDESTEAQPPHPALSPDESNPARPDSEPILDVVPVDFPEARSNRPDDRREEILHSTSGSSTDEAEWAIPEPPRPRRPRPGFWEAILWTVVYGVLLQVAVGIVSGFMAFIIFQIANPNAPRNFRSLFMQPQSHSAEKFNFYVETIYLAGLSSAGALLALVILRVIVGRDWMRRVAFRRPSWGHLLLATLGLPALVYLSDGVYRLAVWAHVPSIHNLEKINELISRLPWVFGILVVGLGPAFAEELWCRGFLGRGLVGRSGYVGGVFLTSFFFGIMHFDPPHVLATFCMGICLHLAYLATRSLWIPMLLHFLNNSLSVLSITLWREAPVGKSIDEPDLIMYPAALILGLTVAWALYRTRARLAPAPGVAAPHWQPEFPGVELPPPGNRVEVVRPRPSLSTLILVAGAVLIFLAAFLWPHWNEVIKSRAAGLGTNGCQCLVDL
jgi:uncharacterized protein